MSTLKARLALCNEVLGTLSWADQCHMAATLGYDGLEVAPGTLGDEPHRLPASRRRELRTIAADLGVAITGLHWLLVKPGGLSITSPDPSVRARTLEVMAELIDLCADLGGRVLVHGSPQQRLAGGDREGALARAEEAFWRAGERATSAGVIYCIEPLAPQLSELIHTFDEAAHIVRKGRMPSLRTMIDTSSAALGESETVPALIRRALPTGLVAHIHFNDRNRKAPGQGSDTFAPVLAALRDGGYAGDIAIEPFVYEPDGATCAARAIGYVRGLLEGLG